MDKKKNLNRLTNYMHAFAYAKHVKTSKIEAKVPGFSFKKASQGLFKVEDLITKVAPLIKAPFQGVEDVWNGSQKPVEHLCRNVRHEIHDRNSLKRYLTVVAYSKGTTLQKMSRALGNSSSYLNSLVIHGTHERMEEKLSKVAKSFDVPDKVMKDAVDRSKVHHRKFAGGYFGGNPNSKDSMKSKAFMKKFIYTHLNLCTDVDKLCKGIDQNKTEAVIETLMYFTACMNNGIGSFKKALKMADMGKYIPDAVKEVEKLKSRIDKINVTETPGFSARLAKIRKDSPTGFTGVLIDYLRQTRAIVGMSGKYKRIKISGFKPISILHKTKAEAIDLAKSLYPENPPKDLSKLEMPEEYLTTRKSLLKKLTGLNVDHKILFTRFRTVVKVDNKFRLIFNLDLFMWHEVGDVMNHSIVRLTPLFHKQYSAKVRKFLRKYNI